MWMQINHPGRQMPAALGQPALAPSAVPLQMGALSKQFAPPKAMTEDDIASVIARFIRSAELAERAGFTGVQIHAAHGYLLSQFLSPLSNRRDDRWGGSLHNRARLLLEIVQGVRAAVSPAFAVAVKLNSADFQRGGFSPDDARAVVEMLAPLGVDLVELSGGSYEAPAMTGAARDQRSLAREAYFLEFAREIATVATLPLMVTGGIRRYSVAEQVLSSGVAMVGIATALAIEPICRSTGSRAAIRRRHCAPSTGAASRWPPAHMAAVKYQLGRLSKRRPTAPGVSPVWALLLAQAAAKCRARRYRRWVADRRLLSRAGFSSLQ